ERRTLARRVQKPGLPAWLAVAPLACVLARRTYDRGPAMGRCPGIGRPLESEHLQEPAMVAAVRVHKPGGPEVMKYEDVEVGAPGQGEIKVRVHACGLNYIDTYF